MMGLMSDLISYDDYLQATGQAPGDVDTTQESRIEWAISAASDAVRAYAGRDFTLSADAVQAPREYRYYDHGIVDIDDATVVNSVSAKATNWSSARTLDPSEWYAMPIETPIFQYIEVYSMFLPTGASPAMGFKNNLDNYPYIPYPTVVVVDAEWGWPTIPFQVKQATVFTAAEFAATDPSPYNSEAIAGYSRSYQSRHLFSANQNTEAVPDRAAALLDAYTRWAV